MSPEAMMTSVAPCGPECRHAVRLPAIAAEWIWCARRGEPRSTTANAAECVLFSSGTPLEWRGRFAAEAEPRNDA